MAKPPEDDQAFLAASRLAAELSQKPQRGNLAFCIYFLLGLGVLAPWNAFITAVDYFGALFPGRHVDRLEAITYLPIMLVTLAAGIHIKVLNTASRIRFAFAGFTVALLAVPLLDAIAVRGGEAHHSMIYVVMALVCLAGFADGVGQGALYGEAALLPDWATQALTGGSAASGVLICALRALTKALLPQDTAGLRISASVYFLVSAALCILCLLLHAMVLPQLPVVRRNQLLASLACAPRVATVMDSSGSFTSPQVPFLPGTPEAHDSPRPCHEPPPLRLLAAESGAEKGVCVGSMSDDTAMLGSLQAACVLELSASSCSSPAAPATATDDDAALASLNPDACHLSAPGCSRRPDAAAAAAAAAGNDAAGGGWRQGRARPESGPAPEARRLLDGAAAASDAADGVAVAPHPEHVMRVEDGGGLEYIVVVRQIWRLAAAICLLYCVTLSIFPGVLAEDVSSQKLGDWYPLVLITLYNLADMLGKMLPPSAALLQQQRLQLLLSVLRVLFVPAFAAAALSQRCPPTGMALLTFLLGLTNGYLTTAAMVAAPHALQPGHAEIGGNVMVLFLVLGLNVGAFSGWLWLV